MIELNSSPLNELVHFFDATSPTPGYGGQLDMDIVVPVNSQLQWSIIGSD